MDLARKILDELMGPERNKMSNEKGSFGVKFSDHDVSRLLLLMKSFAYSWFRCVSIRFWGSVRMKHS